MLLVVFPESFAIRKGLFFNSELLFDEEGMSSLLIVVGISVALVSLLKGNKLLLVFNVVVLSLLVESLFGGANPVLKGLNKEVDLLSFSSDFLSSASVPENNGIGALIELMPSDFGGKLNIFELLGSLGFSLSLLLVLKLKSLLSPKLGKRLLLGLFDLVSKKALFRLLS